MKEIVYKTDVIPNTAQIISLYINSGLKRPVEDKNRIKRMFANSNLIVTAWLIRKQPAAISRTGGTL